MNRLIINQCRCLKRSTLLWETRQYQNFPYITLSRSLSYYTTQPIGHHDITQKPLNTRVHCLSPHVRQFTTTLCYFDKEPLKPSSKVEATVETVKKGIEEQEKLPKKVEKKKSLKERVMDELRHYYHGFKLFFLEIRISTFLLFKLLRGNSLTRREHRLLVTTIGDIFRMVPFIIIVIIPFLEFALPIIIKLFPNMLPSTFESKSQKDVKLKQHLKVKLEMAKFFQETLDQMAPQASSTRHSELAREFSSFFNRIRTSGDVATSEEIMKFSKLFEDEITLDSLQRPHLVALCKVLNVTTIGTSPMLRFNLKMKLRSLAADDKMIAKEGVDSLNFSELQQACKARGMRAYGVSEERLRKELRNWLDLSLNERVPPSLLLLSRALMVPEHVPTTYKLKATISALPEEIATSTTAAIGEKEGKVDFKAKAEAIKLEEKQIKEEKQELQEAEREKQILEAKKREKEELKDKAPIIEVETAAAMNDPAPILIVDTPKPKSEKSEEGLSGKDIEVIEDALERLAQQKKSLLLEKESIQELKAELMDYSEDVKEMQEIVKTKQADLKLTKGARRLYRAVNNMISKLDAALVELESKEKALKNTLEQTKSEPQKAKEHLIQIDELMHSIKSLQKVPDEAKLKLIQDVLGRLDDDFDGQLKIDDVLKMLEIIGNENVNLSEKQMAELIELLDKEEILEVESKIQKALDKAAIAAKEQDKPSDSEGKSLFSIIREAQKRREMKKAVEKFGEQPAIPKSEEIVTKTKTEDSSKRHESH
ncbi:leucine zipper and EF-hand containing transmembrane protein 1 [Anticarsia gemmatalis]|uniref:leucine zipper and EF-hand containing transmembrane protein 1 n=1 Tax=Anticarsia gemmatalis TaxID=129554 RepID=UPI003F7643EA